MRYILVFCVTLFTFANISPCFGAAEAREDTYVLELRNASDSLESYPLEIHAFPFCGLLVGMPVEDVERFFAITEVLREANESDLEAAVEHLPEAAPKEKAMILLALYFSQDVKYLPIINEYVSDDSVAFYAMAPEVLARKRAGEYGRLLEPNDIPEGPLRQFLIDRIRDTTDNGDNYSDYFLSRQGTLDLLVSDFSNMILDAWRCNPGERKKRPRYGGSRRLRERKEPLSKEYWETFLKQNHLEHRWKVKYLVEVASYPTGQMQEQLKKFQEEWNRLSETEKKEIKEYMKDSRPFDYYLGILSVSPENGGGQ